MKATKKIVGAACALVAAVALCAGSTFAWFSANGKVEATGMKVTTTVPTNLYIASGIQSDVSNITNTTVDFQNSSSTSLNPAKIANDTTSQGTLHVQKVATWTTEPTPSSPGSAATYEDVDTNTTITSTTASVSGTVASYVYLQTMSIVSKADSTSSNSNNIGATVTVSWTSGTSYKFLRCGFLIGTAWTVASNDLTTTGENPTTGTWTFGTTSSDALIKNLSDNTVQAISFLVWFDGEDTDCYSNNALSTADLSISIAYSVITETSRS